LLDDRGKKSLRRGLGLDGGSSSIHALPRFLLPPAILADQSDSIAHPIILTDAYGGIIIHQNRGFIFIN
jgi:hypothetical protein